MKKLLSILFIATFSTLILSAQNFSVKGVVIDSLTAETVPYATVSLAVRQFPNSYLKRMAADIDGKFEMKIDAAGEYLLSVEAVGLNKKTLALNITASQPSVNFGTVKLAQAAEALQELTVSAAKPLVKVDLDKIVYDTKSDPESYSNSVLQMLRKVPMVTVDGEDNIQVKGSSSFKVYINGKPSNIVANNPSQALKSIPASTVKNIELITEPGAKYDAEGTGGIINIVTEKAMAGYTGTVNAGLDSYGGYRAGLYFSTKINKFGLTANLNHINNRRPKNTSESERENLTPQAAQFVNQNSTSSSETMFNFGMLEASYEFDSLNLVSLSAGGHGGGNHSNSDGLTAMLNAARDTLMSYSQAMENSGSFGGIDMSLDYQRSFSKPDKLLTFSYRWSHSPNKSDYVSTITNIKNYFSSKQNIKSDAQSNEHTFQADYTEPFNKKHVVEAGVKYILRLNNSYNTYSQWDENAKIWLPIPDRKENDLNHTQNIFGAYGSYTFKLQKFSARAGFRFERTSEQIATADTSFNATFSNLVPSISLSYMPAMTSTLRLSYNQRISRPSIYYLNPFYDNSNPLSVQQGNPNLRSEIENSFSLNFSNFTAKTMLNVSLFTSFTQNSIQSISKLLNDSIIYNSYENIGYRSSSGLMLNGSWQPVFGTRIFANLNLNYLYMNSRQEKPIINKGFQFTAMGGSQFSLPCDFKLMAYGGYMSPSIMLQGTMNAFYMYSLSLSRSFFKNKLNVSVGANDFAEARKSFKSTMNTDMYKSTSTSTTPARNFRLTVSYTFGEMREYTKKTKRTIDNDDLLQGGSNSSGSENSQNRESQQ